ncbi:glucokinase [Friedmanniomyces endolithicus]|nr:glucokinase [Friedmanniomyces endolithicus]
MYAAAGGYRGTQPLAQTATFDAPGPKAKLPQVYNEDALPPMPSWDNATSKHVEDEDDHEEEMEMAKLEHPQEAQQQSLLQHQDEYREPYGYEQPQLQIQAAPTAGDMGTMHATPYHDYDQHQQYAASPVPTARNSPYPPTYPASPPPNMYEPAQHFQPQQQQQQQWGGGGGGGGYAPSVMAPSYHTTPPAGLHHAIHSSLARKAKIVVYIPDKFDPTAIDSGVKKSRGQMMVIDSAHDQKTACVPAKK